MPTAEERLTALEIQMLDTKQDVNTIFRKLDELVVKLSGRPTWGITFGFTTLASLCVGLAVALASRIG